MQFQFHINDGAGLLIPQHPSAAFPHELVQGLPIRFPDGAVHVSQQMEFCGQVKAAESVVCTSKVLARRKRGPFNMLTLGIDIANKDGIIVYSGKTSVLLPSEKEAG